MLAMLSILTVIGLSGIQMMTLEAGAARVAGIRELSLEAAESALIEAQGVVENLTELSAFRADGGCGQVAGRRIAGLYVTMDFRARARWHLSETWAAGTGCSALSQEATDSFAAVLARPRYIIEHIRTLEIGEPVAPPPGAEENPAVEIFRITSRSADTSGRIQVLLQVHYGRLPQNPVLAADADALAGATGRLSWIELLPDD